MKTVLFCKNPYAFGIMKPLFDELIKRKHPVIWYVPNDILSKFPFKEESTYTTDIKEIYKFKSDVIFVPGNEVPHNLRGVKVQIFHGLAGEKKGHFRIRKYFDLYLTQGPYFTDRFNKLAKKFKDFEVIETGWPKLDQLFAEKEKYTSYKQDLLAKHKAKRLLLYAPTFSPSLTSANVLKEEIFKLVSQENLLLIKFHDLMDKDVIAEYKKLSDNMDNVQIVEDNNIIKYLLISDIMISDTSSVVYEFLLLDKPVITLNSSSENIRWKNISSKDELLPAFNSTIEQDDMKDDRKWIIDNYHPYIDGLSSKRMIDTMEKYIVENPVPESRKIPWLRKRKMVKMFGKVK